MTHEFCKLREPTGGLPPKNDTENIIYITLDKYSK
jgi:hypothetical protein